MGFLTHATEGQVFLDGLRVLEYWLYVGLKSVPFISLFSLNKKMHYSHGDGKGTTSPDKQHKPLEKPCS